MNSRFSELNILIVEKTAIGQRHSIYLLPFEEGFIKAMLPNFIRKMPIYLHN